MKSEVIVVVTYGFDYGHVNTLGVYRSMYKAKKAIAEVPGLLDYDYVRRETFVINHSYKLYS